MPYCSHHYESFFEQQTEPFIMMFLLFDMRLAEKRIMSITAKELAKELGISPSAVSIALNNRPGISTELRKKILDAAKVSHYDFSKIKERKPQSRNIYFLIYIKDGTVVYENPFISQMIEGMEHECSANNYRLLVKNIYEEGDVIEQLNNIIHGNCDGILMLGTEMQEPDFMYLKNIDFPIVLIDTYCNFPNVDCVLINNLDGAYHAVTHLIHQHIGQPGYLHSCYPIWSYNERQEGFFRAIRRNGLPTSKSIVHEVCPSVEGAYADMLEIITRGDSLATCYFADNDNIAVGAMRALKEKGYKIPGDISIIGFDNMPLSTAVIPTLSTVHVPKQQLGIHAARRLINVIETEEYYSIKIEVSTKLMIRGSSV